MVSSCYSALLSQVMEWWQLEYSLLRINWHLVPLLPCFTSSIRTSVMENRAVWGSFSTLHFPMETADPQSRIHASLQPIWNSPLRKRISFCLQTISDFAVRGAHNKACHGKLVLTVYINSLCWSLVQYLPTQCHSADRVLCFLCRTNSSFLFW